MQHQERDPKSWPELESARPPATPEQLFAQETVRRQSEDNQRRLAVRTKILLGISVLGYLSAVQTVVGIMPMLWKGNLSGDETGVLLLLTIFNLAMQLSASTFFLFAKNPEFAALVLKAMLIFGVLELLIGFFRSVPHC